MREEDLRELEEGSRRVGMDTDPAALRIMAAVAGGEGDMDPRRRRAFLRGIAEMYRRAGVLGGYLEHEPPDGTVWGRFHAMVRDAACEMARERRGR